MTEEVLGIEDFSQCRTMSKEDAEAAGLYVTIGKDIDDRYIANVEAAIVNKDVIREMQDSIRIVYTPLHGTGHISVMRVLGDLGFTHVYEVPEQAEPDGDFPTVAYPNPEAKEAFALGLELAKKVDAELVLATDPDADRLGVYVKDSRSGEYIALTGNMSGALLCEYVLSQKKAAGQIPEDGQVVKSIVTTNLLDAVAANYGCSLVEVLTGFKWIGRVILKNEETGRGTYMFGMEESYGCLIGTYARDKDAVSAVSSLCEAAAYYKKQGMTLWDVMLSMYERYGYYREYTKSLELAGIEGLKKIASILDSFRKEEPKEFGPYKVERIRDYKEDFIKDLRTGETVPTGLPASNVLYYELNDNAWVCVRPSGTEPKLKFYCGVKGRDLEDANRLVDELDKDLTRKINDILGA